MARTHAGGATARDDSRFLGGCPGNACGRSFAVPAFGNQIGVSYVLVVTTAEHEDDALRGAVGPNDHVKVVVPALKQGLLDWLANDERAFSHAAQVADDRAAELPADDVETAAGEANIALAIRDALATFPADEVVVAVGPGERDDVAARLDPDEGAARTIDGVPLRFVVVPA